MNTPNSPLQNTGLNPVVNLQNPLAPTGLEVPQYNASSLPQLIDTAVNQINNLISSIAPGSNVNTPVSSKDAITFKVTADDSTPNESDYTLSMTIGDLNLSTPTPFVIPTGSADMNIDLAPINNILTQVNETLQQNLPVDITELVNNNLNLPNIAIQPSASNLNSGATNNTGTAVQDNSLLTTLANIASLVLNNEPGNYAVQGKDNAFNLSNDNLTASLTYPGNT